MTRRNHLSRKQVVVGISLGVGLLHFVTGPAYGGPFRNFVNGYLIDILLPFAMYLLLSLLEGRGRLSAAARAAIILVAATGVELLQLRGVPVFGRTFDPVDLGMYALGVAGGVVFEVFVLSRLGGSTALSVSPRGGESDADVE